MEELEQLFDKKNYQEILIKTEGNKDPKILFVRLAALLSLNKSEEAKKLLLENRKALFEFDPIRTLKANFSLRILFVEFDEAYQDYEIFANYPYMNQEVEEALRDIPRALRLAERKSILPKEATISDFSNIFKGKDNFAILEALKALKKKDFPPLEKDILALLTRADLPFQVRVYTLLMLVSLRYDKEVSFLHLEGIKKYLPKELPAPYSDDLYQECVSEIKNKLLDPSLQRVALSMLDEGILLSYPNPFLEKEKKDLTLSALSILTNQYLLSKNEPLLFGEIKKEDALLESKKISELLAKEEPLC